MQLHIFPNIGQLSISVADWMVEYINETLQKQDRFTLVLSGGSTPKKLNAVLASDAYKNKIDWSKVHIFFGDERFVPLSDERSNAKLAYDTLLNHVPVVAKNIHIMQTENISPEDSAKNYEAVLKQYFQHPTYNIQHTTFDLVLLGMGDDGHTLSLFPGKTAVIHETEKLCTSLWLETQDMYRITLTHPIVNNAAKIAFLVNGSGKAKVLPEVLKGNYNPDLYPSQIIKPVNGDLHWFVDEAAAAGL
ncbi:MAG: 6-phosphogluconolactonase [Panacibacter sp.]